MSEMGVKSRHAAISDACPLYPGGTAQVLRNQVASRLLGWKLPQARDGYATAANGIAAE
jgi:hypothetical protein